MGKKFLLSQGGSKLQPFLLQEDPQHSGITAAKAQTLAQLESQAS